MSPGCDTHTVHTDLANKLTCSLGNSGLKISKIILGAMSYGARQWQDWVLDEEEALPLIEHAYKRGINTWDTVHSSHYVSLASISC